MIHDLNALGFKPLLKISCMVNERYSDKMNKIAFSAAQEFIKKTSRFFIKHEHLSSHWLHKPKRTSQT